MYLTLFKDGERVTSLVVGIHGDTMEEVKAYSLEQFEYDEAREQTADEHATMLEEEAKQNEPSEEDVAQFEEVARLQAEAKELEDIIRELKDEYILADMQGNEALKASIREEYKALIGEELGGEVEE